jgi:propionyl-CoA synthetase
LGSGHSYILYGPLLNRNTTIFFEGKPKKLLMQVRFENNFEHKVGTMFTAPTAIRAIKKRRSDGEFIKQYDLSVLKSILAGERCDNATLEWYQQHILFP